VRGHGREISFGLRAFCKENARKIGGKEISGYQGVRLSTLFDQDFFFGFSPSTGFLLLRSA
jgi:hypothetical protein